MNDLEHSILALFQIGVSIQNLNKRAEKDLGLSLVQWCVLKRLIDMPATPAHALAKAVGVHPSTLTQTLKRLEKKTYILTTEDSKDYRKKLIAITRSGRNVLESTNDKMGAWIKNALSTFDYLPGNIRSVLCQP